MRKTNFYATPSSLAITTSPNLLIVQKSKRYITYYTCPITGAADYSWHSERSAKASINETQLTFWSTF